MIVDISKEAVERLATLQEDDNVRPDGYVAADTLRAQSTRIAELEAALKPFADTADCIPEEWGDESNDMEWAGMNMNLTAKNWRDAYNAALTPKITQNKPNK